MTRPDDLRAKLGLPPVSQMGVVVRDMDKAVEYYSSIFGIGPFTIYEFVPEKYWFMEKPSHLKIKQGKAMWGNIEFELMQPLEGESIFKGFLETHGEGLQHLGFNITNYDLMFNKLKGAGFKPLVRVESYVEIYKGYVRACCFDTHRIGGIIFEIIWKSWLMESR